MQQSPKVTIIGAGVSGLCAAIALKNAGITAQIIEAQSSLGGRVQTTLKDNLILDHGFQVLLDSYPAAQKYLDLKTLDLVKFAPGAIIYKGGKSTKVGDPTRDASFLWATAFSSIGSIKDKLKMFSLSRKLKQKSLKSIFEAKEISTLEYLKQEGFSEKIIENFFKPFYAGIFLETELSTSSRMFEFVFKMFSEGSATLPSTGIAAISIQLARQLEEGQIQLNSSASRVQGSKITMDDGTQVHSDYTIIAGQADRLIPNLPISNLQWHEVTVLYFKTNHKGFGKPIIGLVADKGTLTNNFHFLQDLFKGHDNVISVSVVKAHEHEEHELAARVRMELKEYCHIDLGEVIEVKKIKKALPNLRNINYCMESTETQLTDHIYLAGDHLSNGSLNAAMLNGEVAAQAVIDKIEGKVLVG
ncbi:FAD-dependent oxidoreductase [Nonlabens marinus]|uniref:Probable oxidoreductase n=1 Tax=Nonlabens marinus S1-08 TaxID=1454201 RepID=W8VSL8_9FLAO|nr:FAD-dependent oxidoreductase [Nonlabens marinus]BAO56315.1 probable oxidoreductase [Nonlabens marinus S1-08]